MVRSHHENVADDIRSIIHPYTSLDRIRDEGPLVIRRGDGVHVVDDRGRRYLEAMSGLWCASLGFSEKRLAEAAARQLDCLPFYQLFAGRSNEPSIELSARLLEMTAHLGMDKALFACSGSEANDAAVKLIWYYFNAVGQPQKKKLIARDRAYHGVTVMTASLTGLTPNHADFDLPIGRVLRTGSPSLYHYGRPGESEQAFVDRQVAELEELIDREGAETIAAFFAEPVQGAGGVIVPPDDYFPRVQEVLKRNGILLVADEVICGFGRTGSMFGCDTFGIQPDLLTVAKALSGAYQPISATLVSGAVYAGILEGSRRNGAFAHGLTYSGHPVAAAVALKALEIYSEDDIVGHVRSVAPYFLVRLKELEAHPLVASTRGVGLIGALEIVQDKRSRKAFDPSSGIMQFLTEAVLEEGLITRAVRDAVALCPPLVITLAEIDELFGKLRRALDSTLLHAHGLGLTS